MDKRVGILGGGQLGRMLAESANRLNIQVSILDKEGAPAKQITAHNQHITGSFKDPEAIRQLSKITDILTIEIEHIDTTVLQQLESTDKIIVEPSPKTVEMIQDKFLQKDHLRINGVDVTDFVSLQSNTTKELNRIGSLFGYPFMLKTRKDAYDGRGNFPISGESDFEEALKTLGHQSLYAEKWAPFQKELAVMVVQTAHGTLAFPTVETVHEKSICKLVYAPARVPTSISERAQELAKKAIESFKGKGVYGVEMFHLGNDSLLINEIAPRPHNSGHYTIEACPISQFDAHLRAILDLPIPKNSLRLREPAIMLNILGGKSPDAHIKVIQKALLIENASSHLYGKGIGSPGRKMGHITITAPNMAEAESLMEPLIHAVDIVSGKVSPDSPVPPRVSNPLVAVVMGSDSDLPMLRPCFEILTKFSIPFTQRITSAHRTPNWMAEFASTAAQKGIRVIIAAAGGAAHLPGMASSHTSLPVIGVPVKASSTDGMDSLLSIVQMPRGVPVASVGIGNSTNAALLAARILGSSDMRIRRAVEEYSSNAEQEVLAKNERLVQQGWEAYLAGMRK